MLIVVLAILAVACDATIVSVYNTTECGASDPVVCRVDVTPGACLPRITPFTTCYNKANCSLFAACTASGTATVPEIAACLGCNLTTDFTGSVMLGPGALITFFRDPTCTTVSLRYNPNYNGCSDVVLGGLCGTQSADVSAFATTAAAGAMESAML